VEQHKALSEKGATTEIKPFIPEEELDQTYFTIVNCMREPMKAGDQAWSTYGNRTNKFLIEK